MIRIPAAGRVMRSVLTKVSRLIISEQLRPKKRNCDFSVLWWWRPDVTGKIGQEKRDQMVWFSEVWKFSLRSLWRFSS